MPQNAPSRVSVFVCGLDSTDMVLFIAAYTNASSTERGKYSPNGFYLQRIATMRLPLPICSALPDRSRIPKFDLASTNQPLSNERFTDVDVVSAVAEPDESVAAGFWCEVAGSWNTLTSQVSSLGTSRCD